MAPSYGTLRVPYAFGNIEKVFCLSFTSERAGVDTMMVTATKAVGSTYDLIWEVIFIHGYLGSDLYPWVFGK